MTARVTFVLALSFFSPQSFAIWSCQDALRTVTALFPNGKSKHNLAMIEKEKVLERQAVFNDDHFEDRFVRLAMESFATSQGCLTRKLLQDRVMYLEDEGEMVRLEKGTTIIYRPVSGLVTAFTRPPPR